MRVAVYDEEGALRRLAVVSMPSAYSVYAGNRRDVVAEDDVRLYFDVVVAAYLHELRVQRAWLARRLRRELAL